MNFEGQIKQQAFAAQQAIASQSYQGAQLNGNINIPQRPSEMIEVLEQLERNVSRLDVTLGELRARLTPILRPVPCANAGGILSEGQPRSPLAQQIEDQSNRVGALDELILAMMPAMSLP